MFRITIAALLAFTSLVTSAQATDSKVYNGAECRQALWRRWVGSCRREILDHVIVFNEDHLRRLLRDYIAYYNHERIHTRLQDASNHRPVETRPPSKAKVVGLPRVGGLHHLYIWREAA